MIILKKWLARRWGMLTPEEAKRDTHFETVALQGEVVRLKAEVNSVDIRNTQLTIALFNANARARRAEYALEAEKQI